VTIRPALTKLLVVLLLLQWGTAFGHCLSLTQRGAAQADGFAVEICTACRCRRAGGRTPTAVSMKAMVRRCPARPARALPPSR